MLNHAYIVHAYVPNGRDVTISTTEWADAIAITRQLRADKRVTWIEAKVTGMEATR